MKQLDTNAVHPLPDLRFKSNRRRDVSRSNLHRLFCDQRSQARHPPTARQDGGACTPPLAVTHHRSPSRQRVSPAKPQRKRCNTSRMLQESDMSFLLGMGATAEVCPRWVAAHRHRPTIREESPIHWLPSLPGYKPPTRDTISQTPTTMHRGHRGGERMD